MTPKEEESLNENTGVPSKYAVIKAVELFRVSTTSKKVPGRTVGPPFALV